MEDRLIARDTWAAVGIGALVAVALIIISTAMGGHYNAIRVSQLRFLAGNIGRSRAAISRKADSVADQSRQASVIETPYRISSRSSGIG